MLDDGQDGIVDRHAFELRIAREEVEESPRPEAQELVVAERHLAGVHHPVDRIGELRDEVRSDRVVEDDVTALHDLACGALGSFHDQQE